MTLLQYKAEYYGQFVTDTNLKHRHDSLCCHPPPGGQGPIHVNATGELWAIDTVQHVEKFDLPGCVRYRMTTYFSQNSVPRKKYILMEIEKAEIGHPKFSSLREKYIKVQTQNPYDEETYSKQIQFWVRESWVEPLNSHETYEDELCTRLLKKFT